jgi:hypothetical protein
MSTIPGHPLWYVHSFFEPIAGGSGRAATLLKRTRAKTPPFKSRRSCRDCEGSWMRELDA